MNPLPASEHVAHSQDIEAVLTLRSSGAPKEAILEKLIDCFERYTEPEYKAHFLYMSSEVFLMLERVEAAYEICTRTEKLFPQTLYGRVAADRTKTLFVAGGGKLRPIPPFTPTVQVEPTNYCNLDCIMCGRSKKRAFGHMDFDLYKKIVDQSLAAGASAIRLYHMGEPLLNRQIVEFVGYFKYRVIQQDFKHPCARRTIGIQTNGTLLNEGLSQRLMEAGLDDIALSIDGRTSREFERIRKGAKFAEVIGNLRQSRAVRDSTGYSTGISVCVLDMGLDDDDHSRLKGFYIGNGADRVFFMPCAQFEGRHIIDRDGSILAAKKAKNDQSVFQHEVLIKKHEGTMAPHILDRIVVLWNGDIKSSCGEPAAGDLIGNVTEISLVAAYQAKMKNLGFH